jgi:LytR cell envelope-related transcriptional attenuator
MRKSWPLALAVIAVGGLAGVAIAGRPVPADQFVLDPGITVEIADSTTTSTTLRPVATTSEPVATTTTKDTTTTAASTTSVAAPASTSTIAATTTATATTTTSAGPLPRNQVRLVLANGDGRFRLASATADRIAPLGYITDLGDAVEPVGATVVYYRPGFDDEAAIVATDIGVPNALIAPLPPNAAQAVTDSDDRGDVIVLLGPDAPR